MRTDMENSFAFAQDGAAQFPNLLADKDFVSYYWTLPFCNL